MPMKNPPHPGGVLLRQCIEPLGLSTPRLQRPSALPVQPYLSWSTASAAFPLKWPFVYPKFSAGTPKVGSCNRRSMILLMCARTASS
jgi:hypothetical protein